MKQHKSCKGTASAGDSLIVEVLVDDNGVLWVSDGSVRKTAVQYCPYCGDRGEMVTFYDIDEEWEEPGDWDAEPESW